jgi:ubiquinone/menaquinone biosynthesis C-methylase UbiE
MDDIARYNIARWSALVDAGAVFTRPALDLDPHSAQAMIDPDGRLGTIAGKRALCLACGGGQQSMAFAVLGARVTVFDLSNAQLGIDRVAAQQVSVAIETVQGDMRDLGQFEESSFDIVYHAYSLSFVPNAGDVFAQVARVLRHGGVYYFNCANPFSLGLTAQDWNGAGYTLKHPYIQGAEMRTEDQAWVYGSGARDAPLPPPREFRHTLSALVGGLVQHGFVILHISDDTDVTPDLDAEPGSWSHLTAFAPPWLAFWAYLAHPASPDRTARR